MSKTGTVKNYNTEKGFGFIVPNEGSEDIFVLRTDVNGPQLQKGDTVFYDQGVNERSGKPKALNVTGGSGPASEDNGKGGGKSSGGGGRQSGGGGTGQWQDWSGQAPGKIDSATGWQDWGTSSGGTSQEWAKPKSKTLSDGSWNWGVPGFAEALKEALSPHHATEPKWSLREMEERVGTRIVQSAKAFNNDTRLALPPKTIIARVVIEEFVGKAMTSISTGFYDRPWLYKVNFTGPLLASAVFTFEHSRLFQRCLAPALEKYVEEGIFTWAEDERIEKAIYDVVEAQSLKDNYKKKAVKFLHEGFDEAHFKAPYGQHIDQDAGMGMLKDFMKGWMTYFTHEGYNVLSIGIGDGFASKPDQIKFLAQLFQTLASPTYACLPRQITYMLTAAPPTPWPFLEECAVTIFNEWVSKPKAAKDAAKSGGYGPLISQPELGAGAFGRPF